MDSGWAGIPCITDRPQDSHPRLLLHVGYLPVAVCAPAGQSWMGGSVGRATARGTRANQTVRPALSASGRKGTAPHCLCALAAVSRPTSLGQDSGPGCHGFVVPNVAKTTQCLQLPHKYLLTSLLSQLAVNSRYGRSIP